MKLTQLTVTLLSAFALQALSGKELADPARFEKVIASFEAEDRARDPKKEVSVFVGASNIRRWESLGQRFKKPQALNRGFGGAHMSDVAHFASRAVLPAKPTSIYVNAGGNDLHSGRTPEEVLAAFGDFVGQVKKALPKTKIYLLAIPPSPARWDEVELVKKTNALLAGFCTQDGKIDFIDTFSLLLGKDGKPRVECYVEDRLHFSEAGYDIVTSAIRWQGAVAALEKEDAIKAPPANPIVFIGSSSIVRWKTLAEDFPDLPVMNRGFGGSEVFDSFTFSHRTVSPYKPRQVVLYAGGNDINAGKSADRIFADYLTLVKQIHAELPDARISFISIAGNPKRWAQVETVRAVNAKVAEHVKSDPRLDYIDVYSKMLGADGMPLPDIFASDQLHMNEKGYAIWKEVVRPHLK